MDFLCEWEYQIKCSKSTLLLFHVMGCSKWSWEEGRIYNKFAFTNWKLFLALISTNRKSVSVPKICILGKIPNCNRTRKGMLSVWVNLSISVTAGLPHYFSISETKGPPEHQQNWFWLTAPVSSQHSRYTLVIFWH